MKNIQTTHRSARTPSRRVSGILHQIRPFRAADGGGPELAPLRKDPRYAALLDRMKLP